MRLQEYEDQMKELIQVDRNDPKIWELLQEMSYEFFRRKHLMKTNEMNKEASLFMAEDLYTQIINGRDFYHILGYMGLGYHTAIRSYNKFNKHEVIDTKDDYRLGDAIISMFASSQNEGVYRQTMDIDFIKYLPKFIDDVLEKSKYDRYSSDFINAKISICLSFIKNTFVKYNLKKEEVDYVKFLYQNIGMRLRDELSYNIEPNELGSLSILQIYTLDNYVDKTNNTDFYEEGSI